MLAVKLFVLCVSVAAFSDAAHLPSYIKPCSKDAPKEQLSACIMAQAKAALPLFTKGVPELNIDTMDPLALDPFTANAGTFKLREKNALLRGLSTMEVREAKWDLEKNTGQMKIFGNLTLNSDYEADGRVLVIPITGSGKLFVQMYNTEISLKYKIKRVKGPDGVEHLATYDLKPTQTYGHVHLHLSNILGGAAIGDTINQVLNDNWRDLFRDVGPSHTKSISHKVHEYINKLYSQVPFDELFV